ncbi:MAG: TonB-dependent receptor plug domain-containing protein [Pseudobdellovibrio sp.]
MKFVFIPLFLFVLSVRASDQLSEIVLTVADTNFNSSTYQVINEQDIKDSQSTQLAELLFKKTNLNISQSTFEPTSIFIRGGDSSHVLFLLDGVPLYDPSTIQRTTDLNSIQLSSIKKIEIIKGSQSVLYGGQALAAVVKIFTNFNPERKFNFRAQSNGLKQYVSAHQTMNIDERQKAVFGAATMAGYNQSPIQNSIEKYSEKNYQFSLAHLFKINQLELISKIQIDNQKSNIPNLNDLTSRPVDTDQYYTNQNNQKAQMILRQDDQLSISLAYSENQRDYSIQQSQNINGYAVQDKYFGYLTSFRLDYLFWESSKIKAKSGLALETEKFKYINAHVEKNHEMTNTEGLYVKLDSFIIPNYTFEAGARIDFEKSKYLNTTYQFGLSYNKNVKYEFSSGFKNASLYQKSLSNNELKSEMAFTNSILWENKIDDQSDYSLSFFLTQFRQLIDYDSLSKKYVNIDSVSSKGLEYQYNLKNIFHISLTYQEPRNEKTNQWLYKRSLFTSLIDYSYQYNQFTFLTLSHKYVSSSDIKYSLNYVNKTTRLPAYSVFLLSGFINYNDRAKFFVLFDNIFNEQFQTNYSFYSPGLVSTIGFTYAL